MVPFYAPISKFIIQPSPVIVLTSNVVISDTDVYSDANYIKQSSSSNGDTKSAAI